MQWFKEFLCMLLVALVSVTFIMFTFVLIAVAYESAHVIPTPAPCRSYISGEPRPPSYCDFKDNES